MRDFKISGIWHMKREFAMTTDSISRPHTTSTERFQRVVLPATVELIKSAIASSVVNAENASSVVETIANAVARLSSRPGAHDQPDFPNRDSDLSGVPVDVQQVVKNYQKSYLSGRLYVVQPKALEEPVKRGPGRPKKVKLHPVAEARPQPPAPAPAPAARIATPTRDKTATPSVTARAPEPTVKPVQEVSAPSLRMDMKRRKADTEAKTKPVEKRLQAPPESTRKLPRGLSSINEAIQDDYIVCLDDGRKVKDLEKHLDAKGVTMEAYLKKWGLPSGYPTRAPKLILTKGTVYEYNIHSGKFETN
ncbi:MucR family transcriptional regulator [Rhizobium sp. MHM7A]|uniref:MucR family transcriptional regulator n=1 Tax=Rhizobium sp. MHM7A TaxID=2583233 RepID=UPI0014872CA5|nr:MucR family transcriptional regulator [Rhizobium sp. MHM7A]